MTTVARPEREEAPSPSATAEQAVLALPQLDRDPRTRIRRYSQLQSYDRGELYRLLDEAFVAHVGFIRNGVVGVIPMGFARDGESLLLHGSAKGGIMQAGADSCSLTATITLLDGLVYAATLFDSTFNFRSAVVAGTAVVVDEPAAKTEALRLLSERIMPGRWAYVPELTRQQSAATLVLRLPLDAVSLKVRSGPPDDAPPGELWTGTVPLGLAAAEPLPQPGVEAAVPPYVRDQQRKIGTRP